jgi:uracil-DNA glycosylase
MSLHLDARQRAMLEEILRAPLWLPGDEAASQTRATPTAPTAPITPAAHSAQGAPLASPALAPIRTRPAVNTPAAALAAPTATPTASPTSRSISLQPRPAGIEQMNWDALQSAVAACQACGLCASRTQTVFGVGDPRADWLVVGEAPGENEDRQGEPFVGQAGKLLDNMLHAMRVGGQPLARGSNVYIANVLKCRPPGNRNPAPDEVAQCEPFLKRQVQLLQPKIILAMGRFAVQSLLQTQEPIGKLRGRVHQYAGVPVIVTYHPAYLLRNLPDKAKAWEDLCLALATANAPPLAALPVSPAP